jgi:catechol 2,3-dioxygenase-like lactoylglutathione lyase family enzyme
VDSVTLPHRISRNGGIGSHDIRLLACVDYLGALGPELLVEDINKSLRFWRDVCGFTVLFDRPDEGFAYLDLGGAQIMLDERTQTRDWETGPMEIPFGRGINFQISVAEIEPILAALARAGWPWFMD